MKQGEQQENTTDMPGFFRQVTNWKELRFYQKSDVLYQLTYVFCERFLPKYGDRPEPINFITFAPADLLYDNGRYIKNKTLEKMK